MKSEYDGNVDWFDLAHQVSNEIPEGESTVAKKEAVKQSDQSELEPDVVNMALEDSATEDGMLPRATDFIGVGEDFEGCISVEDTNGAEFIINNFEFLDTQWDEAVKMYVRLAGEDVVILSFSQVLVKQAHKLQEHLPVRACIEKVKRYWRFA